MAYKVEAIEGIGAARAKKLAAAGITNTNHLLASCGSAKGRKETAGKTGFTEAELLKWVNIADLLRIKGVGSEFSELLEAAGVDTVKELKTRRSDALTAKMVEVNAKKKLVRREPAEKEVARWIAHAKTLDPIITH